MTCTPEYKRVILIGVDGAGNFFRRTETPNIDRIFSDGALSYDLLTANPTISAECWGAMLHGVSPQMHKLTNGIVSTVPYAVDSPFPSVFRVIREHHKDAVLASFCNWNPINYGIIENNLGVHMETSNDSDLTDRICGYVEHNDPEFLFVQFDEVDGAGHGYTYGSERYLKQITITDGYIGRIYDTYKKRGFLDDTLFLVTADHGGYGTSHGGWTDEEKYVMYAAAGKTVSKGEIGDMQILDNASVVLHALGIEQPENWISRVPDGVFKGVSAGDRPVYNVVQSERAKIKSIPQRTPDSGNYITDFIDKDKIAAYLPFDGDAEDKTGNFRTATDGKIYYLDGYLGKGIRLDDGYVSLMDYKPGDSGFTLSFWMKSAAVSSVPCIAADKGMDDGKKSGFALYLCAGDIKFNAGCETDSIDAAFALPGDFENGLVHIVFAFDSIKKQIRFAYDFGEFTCIDIPGDFDTGALEGLKKLNIGQDAAAGREAGLSAVIDDLVIMNCAADKNDVKKLQDYYGFSK